MLVVEQVPDLLFPELGGCAGPRPLLHPLDQSRRDRISLNIIDNSVKLVAIPHPMVEGFVQPERLAGPAQDKIRFTRAGAFDGAGDFAERFVRQKQNVNMVRHQRPGVEVAQLPLLFGYEQGVDDCAGDFRSFEPGRAGEGLVELAVEREEMFALGEGLGGEERGKARQGTVEAPGQKDGCAFGVPVWKAAAVEAHDCVVGGLRESSQMAGRGPAPHD